MRLFNYDSPIMQFLGKLADLCILNILFVLCCIPIVTIGASASALYTMTLKAVKNEESYVIKGFFQAFKRNFKVGTLSWLVMLFIGIVLAVDYRILPSMSAPFETVLLVLMTAILFFYFFTMIYLFPYIARFENSVIGSLKNAFFMSIACLPYTLLFVLILVAAGAATLFISFQLVGFLWCIIGCSGLAYINSFFFRKIFAKFE